MKKRFEQLEARQDRVEGAIVQIATLLTGQSERIDLGFRLLSDRIDGTNERLDRLIDATIRERTSGAERLLRIEARLDRLEDRVGRD